ncbi:MAG: hypothetical protein QW757_02720 [Candidatus Woesearchaeota archaeon]
MKMRQKKKLIEQYKFKLQEKLLDENKEKLTDKQKQALKLIAQRLKHGKWTEQTLFNEFYTIARDEVNIEPQELFKAAYLVLLGKEKGPKLAPFLLVIKDKAIKLFDEL